MRRQHNLNGTQEDVQYTYTINLLWQLNCVMVVEWRYGTANWQLDRSALASVGVPEQAGRDLRVLAKAAADNRVTVGRGRLRQGIRGGSDLSALKMNADMGMRICRARRAHCWQQGNCTGCFVM